MPVSELDNSSRLVDRVEKSLREEVAGRKGVTEARLPKEHVLAAKLGVSRKTVRLALDRLKKQNLVCSVRGKGTFVVPVRTKSSTVLVFCDNLYHPYSIIGSGVICSVLKDQGYRPNLVISKHPEDEWDSLAPHRDEIAGGILIGNYTRKPVADLIERSKIPLVFVGDLSETVWEPVLCDNVVPDNRALAYRATEYLVRRGHRRIVVLEWGLTMAWGRNVIQGYTEALARYGIAHDPELLIGLPLVPFSPDKDGVFHLPLDGIQQRIDRWFDSGSAPTALIHYSGYEPQIRDILHHYFHDRFAEDAVVAISYPEILQAGFTGYGPATAVCMKLQNLAKRAVELLFRDREGNDLPIRETQEQVSFYRRRNGTWEEQDFE